MKDFINEDFLLQTKTAQELYHDFAKTTPIIDYHCHINQREIAENRRYSNISEAWLAGDHYKWRLMRSNGVDEEYITGNAPDREKFQKFAEAMPKAAGHPVYHWAHLELKRYFNCDIPLTAKTADEVWNLTSEMLKDDKLSVRGIIAQSNVKAIATTDDPIDDLIWHKAIKDDASIDVSVVPTFRPDKAVNIDTPGFIDYIRELETASGTKINDIAGLFEALAKRLDFFKKMGCRASDHALYYVVFRPGSDAEADRIFKNAMEGECINADDAEVYKTALMLFFGRELFKRGMVMQLHYGAIRNTNERKFKLLGPDAGFDCISTYECSKKIISFLNALELTGELPKTILYSLNPNDNAMLDSVLGCFQGVEVPGKIQHGSAWWFNDTKDGMEQHLISLASNSLLGNFIGMLTDSRSFLSYARHEYFRRILCNLLGNWVENGEYPYDIEQLGALVRDISYNNAARYFNL